MTIKNLKHGKNFKYIDPVNIYDSDIGDDVFIGPFVEIQNNVKIGSNTRIQSHSFICSEVTIGDYCFIGHGVMFTNDTFKDNQVNFTPPFDKTNIGNNVLIGSNSTILPVLICDDVTIVLSVVTISELVQAILQKSNRK